MFFRILKIRNRTHTKDITIMMTLSQRNIFLLIRLINQLKVKPVLYELLMFTKILIKLRFIIGVSQAIKWCFQCRSQSFLGIPVHVSTLDLSETEGPHHGWGLCHKTFQNIEYVLEVDLKCTFQPCIRSTYKPCSKNFERNIWACTYQFNDTKKHMSPTLGSSSFSTALPQSLSV